MPMLTTNPRLEPNLDDIQDQWYEDVTGINDPAV